MCLRAVLLSGTCHFVVHDSRFLWPIVYLVLPHRLWALLLYQGDWQQLLHCIEHWSALGSMEVVEGNKKSLSLHRVSLSIFTATRFDCILCCKLLTYVNNAARNCIQKRKLYVHNIFLSKNTVSLYLGFWYDGLYKKTLEQKEKVTHQDSSRTNSLCNQLIKFLTCTMIFQLYFRTSARFASGTLSLGITGINSKSSILGSLGGPHWLFATLHGGTRCYNWFAENPHGGKV